MIEFLLSFDIALKSLPEKPDAFVSATKVETVIHTPIVGSWRLDLPEAKGDCQEVYHFKPDNNFSVVSGAEWTYGMYRTKTLKKNKLPIIVWQTVFDDNNVDCSGVQKDQSGEEFIAYLKMQLATPNVFYLCEDDSGKKCPLTFYRLLP